MNKLVLLGKLYNVIQALLLFDVFFFFFEVKAPFLNFNPPANVHSITVMVRYSSAVTECPENNKMLYMY